MSLLANRLLTNLASPLPLENVVVTNMQGKIEGELQVARSSENASKQTSHFKKSRRSTTRASTSRIELQSQASKVTPQNAFLNAQKLAQSAELDRIKIEYDTVAEENRAFRTTFDAGRI